MVRQVDLLARAGKKAGGFRHEEDAAKHDVPCADIGDAPGKLQGISGKIHMADDAVGLVVMRQDDEVLSIALADLLDSG